MKVLALVSCLFFSGSAMAHSSNYAESFYTLQAPTIVTLPPLDPGPSTQPQVLNDPSGLSAVIAVADQLVAFGQKVWKIVEDNRPVVNVSGFTPVSVFPQSLGVAPSTELENWRGPAIQGYRIAFKNLYGMTVAAFDYRVHFQYAGQFEGKGAYLTGLMVTASNVEVLSGFNLEAKTEVVAISNKASKANPLASATIQVTYRVRSVLKDVTLTDVFHVTGDGRVLKY